MGWRERLRRTDRRAQVDAEIESHIRMAIADRVADGESPEEARRAVLRDFGNVARIKEDARAIWSWTTLEQLANDLRDGTRILRRAPGLSASAIAIIALMIGGNTTIYSAVHGMLSKPAPAVTANDLVSLGWITGTDPVSPDCSYPRFQWIATRSRTLQLSAFQIEQFTVGVAEGTYSLRGAAVTTNYFDTLGVPLLHGRTFAAPEAQLGPSGLAAIVSHRMWQQQLRGAADVIGTEIAIDGHPATIVGVAPPRFQGVWLGDATEIWVPMVALAELTGTLSALEDDAANNVHGVVGRLLDRRSLPQAQAELSALTTTDASAPAAPPSRPVLFRYTGTAARNSVIAERGPRFLAIFSVVTLLTLLIACSNVANLMLARAVTRQREIAIRQSFGASRLRILRLVAAEGLTLALVAWAVAVVVTQWVTETLPRIIPPSSNGGAALDLDLTPDWRVLAYAMTLAIAATVAFTVAPAVRSWRQDLLRYLKAGEQGIVRGSSRLSRALVILQLALSVVLLTNAGLAWRSLSLLDQSDLGFEHRNLLLVTIDTATAAKTAEANVALLDRIVDRVTSVPGVVRASYGRMTPSGTWMERQVRTSAAAPAVTTEHNTVGSAYFATLGVPPVAGHTFSGSHHQTPPAVVINQHLADTLWPGRSPLGQTLLLSGTAEPRQVIGIVPNVRFGGPRRDPRPRFVFELPADAEIPPGPTVTLYARYTGSLEQVVPAIGAALRDVNPNVPMVYVRTVDTDLEGATWGTRTLTRLLVIFAAASLVIAALGQYAAMAFSIRQRAREFGIRLAIGASGAQVLRGALGEGLTTTAAGLALGVTLGLTVAHSARALLSGVTPADAPTVFGVLTLLAATSLAACYLPARYAAGTDPMTSLRQD